MGNYEFNSINSNRVGMNFTGAIRTMQKARERTLYDIRLLYAKEQYTNEFKFSEAGRMVEDLKEKIDSQKLQIAEVVSGKLSELDADEAKLAEVRAMDLDYLTRLNLKMENMEKLLHKNVGADGKITLDGLDDSMTKQMKTYFSEFQNDPIAVALIQERLGGHGVVVAPEDNSKKRQKHLQAVLVVFNKIADMAGGIIGTRGVSEVQDVAALTRDEEEAFVNYCMGQNADFSQDDATLIEQLIMKKPELKTAYESILWQIQMAESRKVAAFV